MAGSDYFLSQEKTCEDETIKIFKRENNFQKKLLNFYIKILKGIKKNDRLHILDIQDLSILILNLRIINSLSCNRILINKGYYHDAFSILRIIHESRYLSEYFIDNPEEAERWIDGAQIGHKEVIEKLGIPAHYNAIYGMLCDFTHSNIDGIIDYVLLERTYPVNNKNDTTKNDTTKMCAQFGPVFNLHNAKNVIYTQLVENYEAMDNVYRYFNSFYWNKFESRFGRQKFELRNDLLKLLARHKRIYR
jgi:hypothetical protein